MFHVTMDGFQLVQAWSLGPVHGRGSMPWQLDQEAQTAQTAFTHFFVCFRYIFGVSHNV